MSDHLERLRAALADRYAISREIGRGGMATVYLARDLRHERDVALKVMRPEMAAVLGQERFLREIRTLATLTHPHILPLYDSGEADGALYYVMPYVEGESLRNRLEREVRLPVGEAVLISREVADALAYAHAHGVIHRDIKPENILLSGGHAVMADFGIARAVVEAGGDRLTATGLTVGTPAYMSPEQALGGSRVDGRSDLYSLACVLFEMLAGEIPFGGPDARAILARKTGERPRALSTLRETVHPPLENAVSRALSVEPADRFATAAEFADALEGSVTPMPFPVPADASVEAGRNHSQRRWGLWAGGLVIVALVLGGWWTSSRVGVDRSPTPSPIETDVAGDGIAVLPFRVVGSDLELWREGLPLLLSTNLDGLGGLRKIDPRVVYATWSRQIGDDIEAPDIPAALAVAKSSGARYAVYGSLFGSDQTFLLTLDVYDALTGEQRGTASVEDTQGDMFLLVNQATLEILDVLGASEIRVEDLSRGRLTRSVVALREYLLGEQESRGFRWQAALGHYEAAVEVDSSFVLALYKASLAHDWVPSVNPSPYLDRALSLSEQLPERDALLLRGHAQRMAADLQAISTLETLVARYPDEVAGWHELGEAYFHYGPLVLKPDTEFRRAFRRYSSLDPGAVTSHIHMVTDAFVRQDSADVRKFIRRLRTIDPTSSPLAAAELTASLAWGDSAAREAALEEWGATEEFYILAGVVMNSITNPDLGDGVVSLVRRLGDRFPVLVRSPEVFIAEAHAGRPDSAWASVSVLSAGAESKLEAVRRLILHVSDFPAQQPIWRTVDQLEAADEPEIRFLVGALAAQQQRWGVVEREIERLTRDVDRLESGSSAASAAEYVQALRGYAQARRGDSDAALTAIEDVLPRLPGQGFVWTAYFAHAVLRQQVGWLLLAADRPAEARRYFESLTYPVWHLNVGMAEACLGEVHERLGNRDQAAEHYERFVRWWENGQPEYRAMAELGRSALERVTGPAADEGGDGSDEGLCAHLRVEDPTAYPAPPATAGTPGAPLASSSR